MTSASIAHLRKYFQDYNVEEYFGIKHELHFGRYKGQTVQTAVP